MGDWGYSATNQEPKAESSGRGGKQEDSDTSEAEDSGWSKVQAGVRQRKWGTKDHGIGQEHWD